MGLFITDAPSPNFSDRSKGTKPDLIIIHGTAGSTETADLEWMRSPRSKVSAHYLVGRTGKVWRLVDPGKRAWHAGVSSWQGRQNLNDTSIGIEIANKGPNEDGTARQEYTAAQYEATGRLCEILMREWKIPIDRILSHALISPGRKSDPWLYFNWMQFTAELLKARTS